MEPQNFANHKRIHPLYHYFLSIAILLIFIGSLVYVWQAFVDGPERLGALLTAGIAVVLLVFFLLVRNYAAKVQDRAIRAEESLRHFALTGRLPDAKLSMKQLIALRFAGDEEFPELAGRAAETGMKPDDIKKSVKNWRADHHRI